MRCNLQAMQFTVWKVYNSIWFSFLHHIQSYTTITIMNFKAGLYPQISKTSLYLLVIWPCVPHPRQPGVFLCRHLPLVRILYEWTHRIGGLLCLASSPLSSQGWSVLWHVAGQNFVPFFPFNVCVYVHICVYECTCMWVHRLVEVRGQPWMLFLKHCLLRQGLSLSTAHQVD